MPSSTQISGLMQTGRLLLKSPSPDTGHWKTAAILNIAPGQEQPFFNMLNYQPVIKTSPLPVQPDIFLMRYEDENRTGKFTL